MKICVVTQQIGQIFNGPGLHASNLVRHLAADGHQVTVVAPENQAPPRKDVYDFVGVPHPHFFSGSQARWLPLSASFGRTIRQVENDSHPDLVHFTDAREAFFCRSNTPWVGNVNDTYSAEIASPAYYRSHYRDWLARWIYYLFNHLCEAVILPRFNALLANSQYTAAVVSRHYPVKSDRLFVIYKSVEAELFAPALELRQRLDPHAPRILCVGGNMQRKGIPDLVRAAPRVLTAFPECEFWLVGNDPIIPQLITQCQEAGVASHFNFMGWKSQADLVSIYAEADVFAMPSLTEAFGVVFLEAMAAGVPVVGSQVGGIPEIICDGENGRLVPPSSPMPLADTLIKVLGNRSMQEQFRSAGLETVSKFSVGKMMAETYQVYRKVVGN